MSTGIIIAQVCAWIAISSVLMFVVGYHIAARWWVTPEGRNVMLLSLVILVFAIVGSLSRYGVIPPDALPYVTAALWVGVACAYAWRTVLMLKAQGFWRDSERRDF